MECVMATIAFDTLKFANNTNLPGCCLNMRKHWLKYLRLILRKLQPRKILNILKSGSMVNSFNLNNA